MANTLPGLVFVCYFPSSFASLAQDTGLTYIHPSPCVCGCYSTALTAFNVDPLQPGYHYIGPTNDNSTQNPCTSLSHVDFFVHTLYLRYLNLAIPTFRSHPLFLPRYALGICSTPVYMLESACGACQNHTYITWSMWSSNCPADMLQEQGTYDQIIPSGTLVPHWAYLKPADYGDILNVNAAKLAGGESWIVLLTCPSRNAHSGIG